mmetsp:Transcript_19673/g.59581  ORF Transcript_19673/g.59581 Transcript_19673/m.59581 type:complete len:428 (+) Transcript_19673:298-1581(+)
MSSVTSYLTCVEHGGDVAGVRGAGGVVVDRAIRVLVQCEELAQEELDAQVVVAEATREVCERRRVLDILNPNLFCEEILLVEEEDHARLREVAVVADLVEELERLRHAVRVGILEELLVVLREGRHEDHGSHIVEAVDPLLALVPLATHVVHLEDGAINLIALRHDTRGTHTSVQHVVLRGEEVRLHDAVDVTEVELHGLHDLELGTNLPRSLNTRVRPHGLDGIAEILIDHGALIGGINLVEGGLVLDQAVLAELLGLFHEDLHGADGVAVHHRREGAPLIIGEIGTIEHLHLLEDGALARLTSAQQQELNLLLLTLESLKVLLLNLLRPLERLLVLLGHRGSAGTHLATCSALTRFTADRKRHKKSERTCSERQQVLRRLRDVLRPRARAAPRPTMTTRAPCATLDGHARNARRAIRAARRKERN